MGLDGGIQADGELDGWDASVNWVSAQEANMVRCDFSGD